MRPERGLHRLAGRGILATLGALGAVALAASCISTPPPGLPTVSLRPTILHDSVVPSVNAPLIEWPPFGQFSVPVQLNDPTQQFCWVLFVDYNPYGESTGPSGLVGSKWCGTASPAALDGGIDTVPFTLEPNDLDLGMCHTIQFLVALQFESDNHTPVTPPGGDDVTWNYVPGGGPQCPPYDAGPYADGAFPVVDAQPVTPPPITDGGTESGGTATDAASTP